MIAPHPRGAAKLLANRNSALFHSLEGILFPKDDGVRPVMERRATARVQAEVVCEEKREGRRNYRLTWDLSTFGLSTQYGPHYPLGTRVRLSVHVPDDLTGPISVIAEVVGTNHITGGMRLAFRNPSAIAVRRLHRYLFGQDN